jgi:hypothetical protein
VTRSYRPRYRFVSTRLKLWTAVAFAVTGALLGVCLYLRSEQSFRIVGGIFQLLGVALIFVGIRQTLGRLGIGLRQIARELGIPLPAGKPINLTLALTEQDDVLASQGETKAKQYRGGTDGRLDMLEDLINVVRAEAAEGVRKEDNARLAALEAEQRARQEADQKILASLEKEVRSKLPLETIGAAWFFIGIALATFAPELACLFSRLP